MQGDTRCGSNESPGATESWRLVPLREKEIASKPLLQKVPCEGQKKSVMEKTKWNLHSLSEKSRFRQKMVRISHRVHDQ
jgi:hypothetical protein